MEHLEDYIRSLSENGNVDGLNCEEYVGDTETIDSSEGVGTETDETDDQDTIADFEGSNYGDDDSWLYDYDRGTEDLPLSQDLLHEYLEWSQRVAGLMDDAVYYRNLFSG
jgi:hypothetical protein